MARAWAPGLVAAALLLTGCGSDDSVPATATEPTGASRTLTVSSPDFEDGGKIPEQFTCRGDGDVPTLRWSGVPADSPDVAVVVDDPDAPGGGYVHWIVIGIPPGLRGVDAGRVPTGASEIDASGGPGWTPPCPPSGTHHYRFTVYAMPADVAFAVRKDAPLSDVLARIAESAVDWGRLTGTVSAK